MAPFSMRCNTCNHYIYKSTKFNARKEDAKGEMYLGIQIYRFTVKCPTCWAEISFKTDPKNLDYACEFGATRNFEPWKDEADKREEAERIQKEEEEKNGLKALENRTEASKREMEILDALDEIRTRNARLERVDVNRVLEKMEAGEEMRRKVLDALEEDERLAKEAFKREYEEVQVDIRATKRTKAVPLPNQVKKSRPVLVKKAVPVSLVAYSSESES
jgi:hypothetical protein